MNSISNTIDYPAMPRRLRPLVKIFDRLTVGTLILTTPEGRQLQFGDGSAPRADLRLHSWQALHAILRNGDIGLAECYRKGFISTTRLADLMRLALRNQGSLREALLGNPLLRFGYRLRHLLRRNSRRGSSRNIQAHYDLGNDFYSLWLDSSMTYSSARFSDGARAADLLHAQQQKYRRMVELSGAAAGDEILEIGCGWGGLAEYAATRNIRVKGVTLSPQQLAYASERLTSAGLGAMATFELQDYRDLHGSYDHIVSIEMLEAVGENYWHTYFGKLRALLRPGGGRPSRRLSSTTPTSSATAGAPTSSSSTFFPAACCPRRAGSPHWRRHTGSASRSRNHSAATMPKPCAAGAAASRAVMTPSGSWASTTPSYACGAFTSATARPVSMSSAST